MSADKERVVSNYPGNSNKERSVEKPPEKKVEKVITGEVVQRKKGLGRKIAETFSGDDAQSVGNYLLFEVVIPAAKSLLSDIVNQGTERALYGESRPKGGMSRNNYTSYNRMYDGNKSRNESSRTISQRARASHDFGEIVLATRGEAEDVLDRLVMLIEQYDIATVSDLYDLVGITGSFTDDKWGWSDLRDARIQRINNGYLVNLPRATPID